MRLPLDFPCLRPSPRAAFLPSQIAGKFVEVVLFETTRRPSHWRDYAREGATELRHLRALGKPLGQKMKAGLQESVTLDL